MTADQEAIVALTGRLQAAISVIKELVDSQHVEYGQGDDDPGSCIHCWTVSYKPHKETCPLRRAIEFLEGLK